MTSTCSKPWRLLALLALASLMSGCSSLVQYNINAPLETYKPDYGYSIDSVNIEPGASKMFVVVIFSGGGARSAALGYGVLEELARNKFVQDGKKKRLFDEVDLVYGVSGGSILAAYYGLHGEGVLKNFNDRFLNLDFQDKIVSRIISFSNQWRLTSPRFGRSDLLEEQLDEVLFNKATFEDLVSKRKGPFVIISATDMSSGGRFDFIQESFDFLCSDLSKFPIARAVAASSAVPLVFSPVTLWNYAGSCNFTVPDAVQAAASNKAKTRSAASSRARTEELFSYLDRSKRPYIHLLDGGLSDNLSIRSILDMEALIGSDKVSKDFRLTEMNKLVVIVVNAQNDPEHTIDQSPDVPGFRDVIRAIGDIPIARYTQESERAMQASIERWQETAKAKAKARNAPEPSVYYVNIALKNIVDAEERETLLNVPTSLYLPKKTIKELRSAATTLMQNSSEFRRLLKDISAERSD
ncbi:MAG: patatin-like phospholipase family protein [Pseudomonadota bacterium]